MLQNDNIDAVELLVPHFLHKKFTIKALEAGKHVSVQKPMANSIAECKQMVSSAKKTGMKLRVFENFRFYPPYILAKKLIDEGKLGRVSNIRIKLGTSGGGWEVPMEAWMWRLDEEQCGGGPICWDDGYHKWSIARWYLGDVDSVFGWIDKTGLLEDEGDPKIDTPAEFIWKYSTPRTYGNMEVSYSRKGEFPSDYYSADERVELSGENGYIWINQCTAKTLKNEAPVIMFSEGKLSEYRDVETDWLASFTIGVDHFIDSIINDTIPEVTPEEGMKIQQFAKAAHESAKSGKPEKPNQMMD